MHPLLCLTNTQKRGGLEVTSYSQHWHVTINPTQLT